MTKARFVTFEGGEGLGKTTNLQFLKTYLEQKGISVLVTREPGGTVLAEKLRALLLETQSETISAHTELLLMFAARSQHLTHVIKPALAQGRWVLCDRFTDATYAYQGGGRCVDVGIIQWLEALVQGDLRPDLTLLFDAPVEVGMRRARQRGALDRFETERLEFFARVRQAYLAQAAAHSERIKIINADQALDQVQAQIINIIKPLL